MIYTFFGAEWKTKARVELEALNGSFNSILIERLHYAHFKLNLTVPLKFNVKLPASVNDYRPRVS